MKLTNLYETEAVSITAHDGNDKVIFRDVLNREFESSIAFLHYTMIPPRASIGYHRHTGSEEVYIIIAGTGIIQLNGESKKVIKGDVILANDGDSHGLINNSSDMLEILVFEGKVTKR